MRSFGGEMFIDPEYEGDLDRTWKCEACGAGNSPLDGECQWCECGGFGQCRRGNCSDVRHFHRGIALIAARLNETRSMMDRHFPGGLAELARIQRENQARYAYR